MIKIKKIKRRCMVNGCKNIHTFTVTRRNESAEIHPLNMAALEEMEAAKVAEAKPPKAPAKPKTSRKTVKSEE